MVETSFIEAFIHIDNTIFKVICFPTLVCYSAIKMFSPKAYLVSLGEKIVVAMVFNAIH